jgi:hypothetical protein
MYLVVLALFGIIAYFAFDTFIGVSSFMTISNKYLAGQKWFISLLLVNIVLLIFTIGYYYYKKDDTGYKGADGYAGLSGDSGEGCQICD